MKTRMKQALLSTVLLLTACGSDDKAKPAELAGIYEQAGYGNIIVFSHNTYETYYALDKFCWRGEQGALADLNMSAPNVSDKGNRLSFTMPGAQAFPVQLKRLNRLPDKCRNPVAPTQSPIQNFELFWHTINDLYAFLPERQIDWQQRYQQYAPLISEQLTDEVLFTIFAQMLAGFNDSHTTLSAEINGEQVDYSAAPANAIADYAAAAELSTEQLLSDMRTRALQLMQLYAGKALTQADAEQPLWWAKSDNNVGYIMLGALGGYAADERDVAGDFNLATAAFAAMMADLAGTDAIIIDNRFNEGGYDDIGSELVRYFLTQPQAVLQKQAKNRLATTGLVSLKLSPAATTYTKPVLLINSQQSVSAAETFSIMMKSIPQVTLLGEASNGALSDMLQIALPNGWLLTLSNEHYLDMQGNSYEVTGIPADIETAVFSLQDNALSRVQAYDTALSLVNKSFAMPFSFNDVEALIAEALQQKTLPGIALAALKNGEPVYSQGFGKASENQPATSDTAFFLASVSKVFNGTLAAIMAADGQISPDLPVSGNIGFELTPPAHFSQPILFKHLLSHTSGILDSEHFNCGYFQSDDGSSLYNALFTTTACPEPAYQALGVFLPNYLQQSGNRYTQGNYQQDDNIQPGNNFAYSNVGAATAALLMSATADKPYTALFEEKLAAPLQLKQTRWDITGNSIANTATRYAKTDGEFIAYPDYGANSWPDGFLTASANDLAKFAMALLADNHPLITAKVQDIMFSPLHQQHLGQGIGYFWGLDHSYASHDGADPGVTTLLLLDRASRNALIVLMNADDNDNEELNDFIERLQVTAWHAIWATN
ncbi:serine hydrolase [Rheinheimera hassiensis]|uniref:serine hydrolase n=1 Tax=Rheinheimera hassiensis TaxID=1193627 RepID=UPI001F06B6DA|nr:serine hydrolase [Rheinheimera hassiensis]